MYICIYNIYIYIYIYIYHGRTKLPNLEMEPKCLTKSDFHQLIPDISRTKNDKMVL